MEIFGYNIPISLMVLYALFSIILASVLYDYYADLTNEKINKALHMLLPEDIIYIEGYLVDVLSMGLKTGTRKQQQHDYLISGYNPGMCFVLYTTKIIFNGRIYQ